MKLLRDTEFSTLELWNESFPYLVHTRKASKNISDEVYKEEMLDTAKQAIALKAKGIITDNRDFTFTISPTVQEWLKTTTLPMFAEAGTTHGAFVVSDDLFTQVSTEQALADSHDFAIAYFKDIESALDWLTEGIKEQASSE